MAGRCRARGRFHPDGNHRRPHHLRGLLCLDPTGDFDRLARVSASQGELGALYVARTRLAAAGVEAPLVEGQQSGSEDRYAWVVDVRRQNAESESESRAKTHASGYWVAVEVSWRDEVTRRSRSLQLKTLKVALPK